MHIFSNILHVLKAVGEAILKLLGFLMLRLYLWIPSSYFLLAWLSSLIFKFSLIRYSTYIIVAICLCLALSILLMVRKYILKPTDKRPEKIKSAIKGAYIDNDDPEELPPSQTPSAAAQPVRLASPPPPPPRSYDQSPGLTAPLIKQTYADEHSTFLGQASLPYPQELETPPTVKNDSQTRLNGTASEQADLPELFRTRKDPTLYVAEYPDRIEYLRKTPNGFILLETELKN